LEIQDEFNRWKQLSPAEFCDYLIKKHLSFRTFGFATLSLILIEVLFIPGAAPLSGGIFV
jgi:hypothetical protein